MVFLPVNFYFLVTVIKMIARKVLLGSLPIQHPLRICSGVLTTWCQRLHTSGRHQFIKDKDHDEREKQMIVSRDQVFDEAAQKERSKRTFEDAVHKYKKRHDKYLRGHVEFIYAALRRMKVIFPLLALGRSILSFGVQ